MENWYSDNGDGTFTNPILYADYSDPDAIRVGGDFYLTASSFCNVVVDGIHRQQTLRDGEKSLVIQSAKTILQRGALG